VREDLAQSFSAGEDEKPAAAAKAPEGSAYLDLINTDAPASVSSPAPKAIAAPKRGRVAKPKEAAKSRGRPKATDSGLKEV